MVVLLAGVLPVAVCCASAGPAMSIVAARAIAITWIYGRLTRRGTPLTTPRATAHNGITPDRGSRSILAPPPSFSGNRWASSLGGPDDRLRRRAASRFGALWDPRRRSAPGAPGTNRAGRASHPALRRRPRCPTTPPHTAVPEKDRTRRRRDRSRPGLPGAAEASGGPGRRASHSLRRR